MGMTVAMVQVRVMRMPVRQLRVPMPMRVRLGGRRFRAVLVLVVRVVVVPVLMFQRLMRMVVVVPLRKMQP